MEFKISVKYEADQYLGVNQLHYVLRKSGFTVEKRLETEKEKLKK